VDLTMPLPSRGYADLKDKVQPPCMLTTSGGEQVLTVSVNHTIRIIKNGPTWIYEFNGARCSHSQTPTATLSTPSCNSTLPNLSLENLPALGSLEEEHMNNTCAGLVAHSISTYKPMNAFFCHLHTEFITPFKIKKHIRTHHGKTLPCGNNIVGNFLNHLEYLYPSISDTGNSPLPNGREFLISTLIAFLPDPALFALCPSTSCSSVFKWNTAEPGDLSKAYRVHMKASQSCRTTQSLRNLDGATNEKEEFQPTLRFAQLAGKGTHCRWVFYLPEDWKPLSFSIPCPSTLAIKKTKSMEAGIPPAVSQPYIIQLGWDKAFLPQHIAAFKSLLKMNIGEDASVEEIALAHGLSEVQNFLYVYLESANQFVESRCSIVRQSITKG
jgi:hypothetical protein